MAIPPRSVGSPVGQHLSELHHQEFSNAGESTSAAHPTASDVPETERFILPQFENGEAFSVRESPQLGIGDGPVHPLHQLQEHSLLILCTVKDDPKGPIVIEKSSCEIPDRQGGRNGRIEQYEMFLASNGSDGATAEDTLTTLPDPQSFPNGRQSSGNQQDL